MPIRTGSQASSRKAGDAFEAERLAGVGLAGREDEELAGKTEIAKLAEPKVAVFARRFLDLGGSREEEPGKPGRHQVRLAVTGEMDDAGVLDHGVGLQERLVRHRAQEEPEAFAFQADDTE